MLIQCKIPEADNIVHVGGVKYHFIRNDDGHLVCNVDDESVQRKLLESPEYELYTYAPPEEPEDPTFGEPVEVVPDSGTNVPDSGAVEPSDDTPPAAVAEGFKQKWTRDFLETRTYEELQGLFHESFGKAAHPSSKHETLLRRLLEVEA